MNLSIPINASGDQLNAFEKKALENYVFSRDKSKTNAEVTQYISEASEALFKSICIRECKKRPNDEEINSPVEFLYGKEFFGKFTIAIVPDKKNPSKTYTNKKHDFKDDKFKVIKKDSEAINSVCNPKKHSTYKPTHEDVTKISASIKSILKWYFSTIYDYKTFKLSEEERKILEELFSTNPEFPDKRSKVITEKPWMNNPLLIIAALLIIVAIILFSKSGTDNYDSVNKPDADSAGKIIKEQKERLTPTDSLTQSSPITSLPASLTSQKDSIPSKDTKQKTNPENKGAPAVIIEVKGNNIKVQNGNNNKISNGTSNDSID